MPPTHHAYTRHGRIFSTGEERQYVYRSRTGQVNVETAPDVFAAYVWDAKAKAVQFGDCELRFTAVPPLAFPLVERSQGGA